jgi:6-phosphogluconolactonase
MPQIEVFRDAEELAEQAAKCFVEHSKEANSRQGKFVAALSGGSTTKRLFHKLAGVELDWSKVHLFWVDERCVPPDHPDSNFGMTAGALLNHIGIPWQNIHRIPGELPSERAAALYEFELHRFFGEQTPVFDLILLGLGSDGHTASLFPGDPGLNNIERWVIGVKHEVPPPPLCDRVSLTLPVLEAAKKILFSVSGKDKAAILREILSTRTEREKYPVERLTSLRSATWFIDQDAACDLDKENG